LFWDHLLAILRGLYTWVINFHPYSCFTHDYICLICFIGFKGLLTRIWLLLPSCYWLLNIHHRWSLVSNAHDIKRQRKKLIQWPPWIPYGGAHGPWWLDYFVSCCFLPRLWLRIQKFCYIKVMLDSFTIHLSIFYHISHLLSFIHHFVRPREDPRGGIVVWRPWILKDC